MARKYWLTGAGNGLGAALAEAILQSGAQLAISARVATSCEALSQRYPGQVLMVPGNLTDSQTVREIGQRLAQEWGALDTVIINAGTAEYVAGQPTDNALIEHIIRSNLLAASFCIATARPLLRQGAEPHLVGIASPVTYLRPSEVEGDGNEMRHVFESARTDLASNGIDLTLVIPGFDNPATDLNEGFSVLARWTAETAASHILTQLAERPHGMALPAAAMTKLWPLPSSSKPAQGDTATCQNGGQSPIKGQP
ncbi:SDR family NAD(P)-dependent oxidoreductase [Pseudomonas brassicacearum]|jgi:NAD(P)-dependent dehydrogenase (short-subunit alcohol dehydrogenase family)|uniref:SDR family NAD(P)-dependent oxidoreductase n=1 Tax=Pseudomonas brassicacearum subsp. neoaurantiaca TaxID=494916 RepID=A0A7V8UCV0_9PSED|nr:SDR family NAD(P)-dependent oxidoreductase [Pseudomonas brassicacearum]MBA1378158.1 SDR family NAD(P)-dependent oxidoreductase [Pseudomonas brassicacearum subsp. neoaurantiaca]